MATITRGYKTEKKRELKENERDMGNCEINYIIFVNSFYSFKTNKMDVKMNWKVI